MPTLIETLKHIVYVLQVHIPGCSPVSVGGSVRDAILFGDGNFERGLEIYAKDYDLEIFNTYPQTVIEALHAAGYELNLVGSSFAVYKVKGWDIDISFPRRERATGPNHTDYEITVDPDMTYAEAALRRDFTVNSLGYCWNTKRILDPYNGVAHIASKLLNPVSEQFKEDALRVMRAFKFIARYGFAPSIKTVVYCRDMIAILKGYARERLMKEWEDFILKAKSEYVEMALQFLIAVEAQELYCELFALCGVEQQLEHHPEGDAFVHTIHCFKEYCNIRGAIPNQHDQLVVGFAVLCHDLGKASTTLRDAVTGKITAYGHEDTKHARQFMERIYHPADETINEVERLVKAHMRPIALYKNQAGLSGIRRLNVAVNGRTDLLMHVVWCDQMGRPGMPVKHEALSWFADQVKAIGTKPTEQLQPIIKGRHVLQHLDISPGPRVGAIIKQLFEDQLDGKFSDEASGIAYLQATFPKV